MSSYRRTHTPAQRWLWNKSRFEKTAWIFFPFIFISACHKLVGIFWSRLSSLLPNFATAFLIFLTSFSVIFDPVSGFLVSLLFLAIPAGDVFFSSSSFPNYTFSLSLSFLYMRLVAVEYTATLRSLVACPMWTYKLTLFHIYPFCSICLFLCKSVSLEKQRTLRRWRSERTAIFWLFPVVYLHVFRFFCLLLKFVFRNCRFQK